MFSGRERFIIVIGLGTDIVEISRIKKAIENQKFLERVYTEKEQDSQSEIVEKEANIAVAEEIAGRHPLQDVLRRRRLY